ncbi:MAG TPA: hypothetical protein DDX14_01885 [Cyanobacteria bacterium UBA9579]|nr:hypothetical protein [Cyanobacteria bacterium UBA9579]
MTFYAVLMIFLILAISGSKLGKFEFDKAVNFYSPTKGIYVVDINVKKCPECIVPYVSNSLETVKSVAEKTNSVAAINAGFFDPTNTQTTSYIIENGDLVADPRNNLNLISNPGIEEYLPAILNRSEFRIANCHLNCDNYSKIYNIAQHNDPVEMKCEIIHSIQAGPELIPDFKLEEEAFVVKKDGKVIRQSAGALGKYARSAIGIKKDHILLVAVSNENPMTLEEIAEYMKSLEVDQALALDGGSSTSMYVNLPDQPKFVLTSAKDNAARRVKSIILIKPKT